MIKFFGTTSGSINVKNFASRVGSQCLVSGVLLQTSNIFLRCNEPEIKHALGLKDSSEAEVFSKLRDLKDSF